MQILITICGRGGSKGIPGKNIRLINGKPLIQLSIDVAKAFANKYSADIALSTDSIQIRDVAAECGLLTEYLRPEELATDESGKLNVISHVLNYQENKLIKRYDYVLDLDITSPLRNIEDLELAFSMLQNDKDAINIFSVNPANRNPYFNMVEEQPNGYYGLVKKGYFLTRQSAPKVYDLNASFYFYRRIFFGETFPPVVNDATLVYVMPHICFDLDHPIDFLFMEYLLTNNKLGFNL